MAEVVVVGAGLGGLASAARLAKLGHRVRVFERNHRAGGALHRVEQDGFCWDAGAASTTLPAVLRDLFRKSGRPIERYVDLSLRTPARRHVFEDGAVVDLPTGSRGAQIHAVDTGLGAGSGIRWAEFVDAQASVWDDLRRHVLDAPDGGRALSDRSLASSLWSRRSLAALLRKAFKDERLRLMVDHAVRLAGSDPKDVPAYAAVDAYVERSFGVWEVADDSMAAVTDALVTRLDERDVQLELGREVVAITVVGGKVSGVVLDDGEEHRSEVVVTDIDPRHVLGALLPRGLDLPGRTVFDVATPAIPPSVTHLGLSGPVPALPSEVVLHGDPLLVVTTTGRAPAGHQAWTVLRRGSASEDVLLTLVRRGLDLRDQVVARLDRSPVELLQDTAGSPYGLRFAGRRAQVQRAVLTTPLPGLHLVGASVHPGATIPYVAWGAAHVAERLGRA